MGAIISPDMGVALSESPETAPPAEAPVQQETQQTAPEQSPGNTDKGFPENTPVAQMSDAEKAAYYRYHNRQAENTLKSFKGVKPEDVSAMQQELEALRNEKLSADQKAIKEAEKAARAAAEAEWRPKLQTSQLRAIASEVLKGDQLNAWLSGMNPAAFAGENGEIDEEKVIGHLTAAFGVGGQDQQHQQPQRSWGQYSAGNGYPPERPGAAGRAEAAKRFGKTTTSK